MSQSKSQVNLELDKVESEPEKEDDTVDDDQARLVEESSKGSEGEDPVDDSQQGATSGENSGHSKNGGLEKFGVDKDPSPHNPRLDNPDGGLEQDRRTNTRTSPEETEQEALFPDIEDENQVTLTGKQAYNQCLFGQD